ncbi:hypothetical protein D3C71_1558400 [compost metagenome]
MELQLQPDTIVLFSVEAITPSKDVVVALQRMVELSEIISQVTKDGCFTVPHTSSRINYFYDLASEVVEYIRKAEIALHHPWNCWTGCSHITAAFRDFR